jgi:hypothetical protein
MGKMFYFCKRKAERENYEDFRKLKREHGYFKPRYSEKLFYIRTGIFTGKQALTLPCLPGQGIPSLTYVKVRIASRNVVFLWICVVHFLKIWFNICVGLRWFFVLLFNPANSVVTFWYGSGYGSSDPYLYLTDPDADPGSQKRSGSECGSGILVKSHKEITIQQRSRFLAVSGSTILPARMLKMEF